MVSLFFKRCEKNCLFCLPQNLHCAKKNNNSGEILTTMKTILKLMWKLNFANTSCVNREKL